LRKGIGFFPSQIYIITTSGMGAWGLAFTGKGKSRYKNHAHVFNDEQLLRDEDLGIHGF
jgi:hypothetical protein